METRGTVSSFICALTININIDVFDKLSWVYRAPPMKRPNRLGTMNEIQ